MAGTTLRSTMLGIAVAALLVSAGCSAFANTSDTGPTTTPVSNTDAATPTPDSADDGPASEPTQTPTATSAEDAIDLRSVEKGEIEGGEIDRGDPVGEQGYYEPVTMEGVEADQVTFVMESAQGDPQLKVVAPNGTVIATDDNRGPADSAEIEDLVLPAYGEYTILAMSAEPNATFQYALDLTEYNESAAGWFAGEMSTWNESERYAEFAQDIQYMANGDDADTTPIDQVDKVNPEKDYVLVTVQIGSDDPSGDTLSAIDAALLVGHDDVIEDYRQTSGGANESWLPDRVYYRLVTPEGELYRTNYVSQEMMDAYTGDNFGELWFAYLATGKYGPVSDDYVERADNSTEELDYPEMDEDTEKDPP